MAKINGKDCPAADGMTVTEYLGQEGLRPEQVAVELNEAILPKDGYDSTVLSAGDTVEIVQFMGGG